MIEGEAGGIIRRRDASKRMARFYLLALQPTLSAEVDLVREWGRIGSPGRVRNDPYRNERDARFALGKLIAVKRRRGYN